VGRRRCGPARPLAPPRIPRARRADGCATAASSPVGPTHQPSPNPPFLSPPLYPPPRTTPPPTSRRSPACPRLAQRRRSSVVSPAPSLSSSPPPRPFFLFPCFRGILAQRSPGPASWRSAAQPWRLGPPARSAPASPALGAPSLSRARPQPRLAQPRPHLTRRLNPGPARPRPRRPAQLRRVPPPRRGRGQAMARPRSPTSGMARLWCGGVVRPPCPLWRRGSPARGSARPCARPARRGGVAHLPCPLWRRGSPARDLGAARPWRPELDFGARRGPRRPAPTRPGCWCAAMAPPRLRHGAQPRPARFARVARPRRRGVARPLASQLACGNPRGLLVAARPRRVRSNTSLACTTEVRGLVHSLT
jgi:hypothetical protein